MARSHRESGDDATRPGGRSGPFDRQSVLALLAEAPGGAIRFVELANRIGVPVTARPAFKRFLKELVDEGTLDKFAGSCYRRPRRLQTIKGRLRVHPAGYAFLISEIPGRPDVYIASRNLGGALDGDTVEATVNSSPRGLEGRVVAVVERGRSRLTGTLERSGRRTILLADDPRLGSVDIELEADLPEGAYSGQAVLATITRFPAGGAHERRLDQVQARVERVLGRAGTLGAELEKIIAMAELPVDFSFAAVAEASRAPAAVSLADLAGREDLRHVDFMTIDPEDARDHDDAVAVERTAHGYRAYIGIADVSHYVRPGTAIDADAFARGCSVYLPDRVLPMLPRELSSEICSLKGGVDRLALVAIVEIDGRGQPTRGRFAPAVIRSRATLSYGEVAAALDHGGEAALPPGAGGLLGPLRIAGELYAKLRRRRLDRGALDLDLPEPRVILGVDGEPTAVVRRATDVRVREAYRLIEELMLLANEAVAEFLIKNGLPTVWRVHEPPDPNRLQSFFAIASAYGLDLGEVDEQEVTPSQLGGWLAKIADHPAARSLNYLLLRSLKQAAYDVVNVGHFGLALPAYLHFTSPIRRYPDLVVHRLLKNALAQRQPPPPARDLAADVQQSGGGQAEPRRVSRSKDVVGHSLKDVAMESSLSERRAMEAEREVVDLYRAWLMRDHVGEVYQGTITSVVSYGCYLELDDPYVEGLLHVESLGDDFFEFVEEKLRLVGRRSGRGLGLGDRVTVRVERVSLERREIRFGLVDRIGGRDERYGEAAGRRPEWERTVNGRWAAQTARRGKRGTETGRRRERGEASPGGERGEASPGGERGEASPGGERGEASRGGKRGEASPGRERGGGTPGGETGRRRIRSRGFDPSGSKGPQGTRRRPKTRSR